MTEQIVSLASFADARHRDARLAALNGTLAGTLPSVIREQQYEIKQLETNVARLKTELAKAQGLIKAAKSTSKYNVGELIRLREEHAERSTTKAVVLTACIMGMLWGVVDAILFGIHAENAIMDVSSVIRFMLIFGPICVMVGMFAMWDHLRACRLDDIENAPGETGISTESKTKNTTYSSTPAQKMQHIPHPRRRRAAK